MLPALWQQVWEDLFMGVMVRYPQTFDYTVYVELGALVAQVSSRLWAADWRVVSSSPVTVRSWSKALNPNCPNLYPANEIKCRPVSQA